MNCFKIMKEIIKYRKSDIYKHINKSYYRVVCLVSDQEERRYACLEDLITKDSITVPLDLLETMKVDRDKYPNAKQEKYFEKIKIF